MRDEIAKLEPPDPPAPWSRRPGESGPAYRTFLAYRDLGQARSIDRVAISMKGGPSPGQSRPSSGRLRGWSTRWDWVARCVAWDDHLQRERDRVAIANARKWEIRRQSALEDNWLLSQELRRKVNKMLAWPIGRVSTKDGLTVVEPMRWNLGTAAMMAKTAAELEAAVLLAVGSDPSELTEDEARAVAETMVHFDLATIQELAAG